MSGLLELARRLHEEKLFIKSEQETIWKLNDQVRLNAEQLSHSFWKTRQHYLNLNKLIMNTASPTTCTRRSNQLDSIQFVDAYKILGYQESMYGQFLEEFLNNPTLAAACLAYGDKLGIDGSSDVARTIVLGCYGNSIITDDHRSLLELMETLLLLQLANEEQPRRLLQKGSCTFCVVFRLFTESLLAGKLFLTAALHQPIMEIIMNSELTLETNPNKILDGMSKREIEKRFGNSSEPSFQVKLKEHVVETEKVLSRICLSFVDNLTTAMSCFPQSLGWIIARAYHIVKDGGLVTEDVARSLSADFLLQQFVCPAVLDPELHGITGEAPVSDLARDNLMHIAQVLQVMAHRQEGNQQTKKFFTHMELDKAPMQGLIDSVIESCSSDGVPTNHKSPHGYVSSAVHFTVGQLSQLVHFLNEIQQLDIRGVDQSSLSQILSHLPTQPPPCMVRREPNNTEEVRKSGSGSSGGSESLSPSGGSSGDLLNISIGAGRKTVKGVRVKSRSPRKDEEEMEDAGGDTGRSPDYSDTVLVISLNSNSSISQEPPGTIPENEVMEMQNNRQSTSDLPENPPIDTNSLTEAEGMDKRSRFSVYSGGSDMSEMGQELPTEDGISRTSGSSSMDLDQAEAASSHGNQEEEEEGGDLESVTHANNDEALKDLRRKLPTSRESIEDKMRKFEIRQELGVRFADPGVTGGLRRDESGSLGGQGAVDARSETWSMDVYASDSEAPTEQESQSERLREIAEDPAEHIRAQSASISSFLALTRDEDTRSDVWSVEVLPSDSEPPDVRPEVRLEELESESGNQPTEDALEDNRSRASTPGLSAASGFSGVSGLSLVSENNQAKVGEEQGGSERSFGKGPNSISPDAEDLLTRGESAHGIGGSSSNSSEDRPKINSSASPSPRLYFQASQSPVAMMTSSTIAPSLAVSSIKIQNTQSSVLSSPSSKAEQEKVEAARSSASLEEKRERSAKSKEEKSVGWKIPSPKLDAESDSDSLMQFTDHINTIKRSPYKKHSSEDNSARSEAHLVAWDEKPSQMNHDPSSAFVPVQIKPVDTAEILKDFDPLSDSSRVTGNTSSTPAKSSVADSQINESLSPNNFNMNIVDETLVEMQPDVMSPTQLLTANQQNGDAVKKVEANSIIKEIGKMDPPSVENSGGQYGINKALDRKKSWWQKNRFSSFSKKKKTDESSPRQSAFFDSSPLEEGEKKVDVINSENLSPGEDIMQKYMKKVSSNHDLNKSGDLKSPEHDGQLNSTAETLHEGMCYQSDLNDSQNQSGSTATDAQSPISDDTVTTATRGASSTSSLQLGSGDWRMSSLPAPRIEKAIPTSCPGEVSESPKNSKEDAKRKLRIVLSSSQPLPEAPSPALLLLGGASPGMATNSHDMLLFDMRHDPRSSPDRIKFRDQILSFLRSQHAEALTLQDPSRIAQLHEVIRSIKVLDDDQCRTIVQEMWREYKSRSAYIAYLVRSRQHLLSASSYLRHVTNCTERDRTICRRNFTSQCVQLYMKKQESYFIQFQDRFRRSTERATDEKVSSVAYFLSWLYGQMLENPVWEGSSKDQLSEAQICIERRLFSSIYRHAIFPNGDGDILRDQLFHDHISRLSIIITPNHPSLLVRSKYLQECPWPSAQREASALAAHRSPRGKLHAALKCCRAVMHLLKLADESEAPGADDFTPVLVFVLIKSNPSHLLSTVQYVNSFMGEQLGGEDAYWWMQFTAATEFIKTIDERKS